MPKISFQKRNKQLLQYRTSNKCPKLFLGKELDSLQYRRINHSSYIIFPFLWKIVPPSAVYSLICHHFCHKIVGSRYLCNHSEYFFFRTLLFKLVEKSLSSKHPQLMLRRTESIVEKMLTNWLALAMYDYMRDYAGSSLFVLFKAIKFQVSVVSVGRWAEIFLCPLNALEIIP